MANIPVKYIEDTIREMLSRPEMFAVSPAALAAEVGMLFEMINRFKFEKNDNPEWRYFVNNNSTGSAYFGKVKDMTSMRNALDKFLREQYHKNGDIWISE